MHRVSLVRAGLVAAALAAITFTAAPAGAGGPTSVLLSVPGAGSTASLYYTDPEYDELAELVGVTETSDSSADKTSGGDHAVGAGVTVTWLIHDVEPWRVDRIYLGGQDGPWISTQSTDGSGSIWDSSVVWHRPANPARLADLLDRLGMNAQAAQDGGFDGVAGAPVEAPAAPVQNDPAQNDPAPSTTRSGADAAWWALAGLAAGVLMTAAWTRYRRRNPADDAEVPSSAPDAGGYAEVLTR